MALNGNETLQVLGQDANGSPAAITQQTTTGAIAALASAESAPLISTAITTVGNGTLTAAGLVGGQIVRTGPVAAYSDATATAVQIVAALPVFVANSTFLIRIKNGTAFTQTITAGVGVTLPPTVIIPAFSIGNYFATINSATAVTLTHLSTMPIATGTNLTALAVTSIATVGAGTITAAAINGGYVARAGSQSGTPFTDTTDTAAAIIAAAGNLVNKIGTSLVFVYGNTTNALATITGGTGVTVSGVTTIPAGMVAQYLITYTAAATITMVGIGVTQIAPGSFAMTGSTSGETIIQPTAIASGTLTLPAATDTLVGRATTDTLTNKTLVDSTTTIVDDGDATKILNFQLAGMTTGKTATIAASTANNATFTLPAATGTLAVISPTPIAVGSTLAITAAMSGSPILLNTAAGSTATLPAATGSGNRYKFIVSTTATSNSHKILAASVSDFINGLAIGENANTCKAFASAAATNHSIQMPFAGTQPSGGFIGDYFEFVDIATNLWQCNGMYQAGVTPTTPFSSATT